ncbi:hypothetical protein [Streptomyces sp. NPDC048508]|uniref:hypothetical protein n=1 Tax=Streptomyces sp. NPDC048508 TaxID=3365561 RepID=UPI00371F5CCB
MTGHIGQSAAEQKRVQASSTVHSLLEMLDGAAERAIAAADVAEIRRRRASVARLVRINPTRPELNDVLRDIDAVRDIQVPAVGASQDHYQQQLGEAVGRLKATAEMAYDKLNT